MGRIKQEPCSSVDWAIKKSAIIDATVNYGDRLMGFLVAMTRNRQDACDLYQETWVSVMKSPRFDEHEIQKGTLVFIKAKQLFKDSYRKSKSDSRKKRDFLETLNQRFQNPATNDAYTHSEEVALKEKFWSEFPGIELSEEKKNLLWLHARYGYTFAEIQEITGIPKSTASDWVSESRKALKDFLNHENEKFRKI